MPETIFDVLDFTVRGTKQRISGAISCYLAVSLDNTCRESTPGIRRKRFKMSDCGCVLPPRAVARLLARVKDLVSGESVHRCFALVSEQHVMSLLSLSENMWTHRYLTCCRPTRNASCSCCRRVGSSLMTLLFQVRCPVLPYRRTDWRKRRELMKVCTALILVLF